MAIPQRQNDPLLQSFLHAGDEVSSEHCLTNLLAEHVDPLIDRIIAAKLRGARLDGQQHDLQDVRGEVVARLVERLHECKAAPATRAIQDLRGYVAVTAYNACHEYHRERSPLRHSLKNRLRYLLAPERGFDVWEDESGDLVCGCAVWRQDSLARSSARLEELISDPLGVVNRSFASVDSGSTHAALVSAILHWLGHPLELDRLVDIVGEVAGVKDVRPMAAEGDARRRIEDVPDPGPALGQGVEQRSYLAQLWAEIRELPLTQRIALLLNLRDETGNNAVILFPALGIASLRDISFVLSIPVAEFARQWASLPLEDAIIAARLGVARQQVINLRKAARARLARRMKALDIAARTGRSAGGNTATVSPSARS